MCGCLFILGTNYQNNLMLLLCTFLLALMLLNLFISYKNLTGMQIKSDTVKPVYAKNHAALTLHITDDRGEKMHGTSSTRFAGRLQFCWMGEDSTTQMDLDTGQFSTSLPIYFPKRGMHQLSRVTCYSVYPLGLFKCWTHLDFNRTACVYPAPRQCPVQFESSYDETGQAATLRDGQDDFYALSPYREGETLNRVAWKHVARTGTWVTKAFSQPVAQSGMLTLPQTITELEAELEKLAYQVIKLSERGQRFGLSLPGTIIAQNSGDKHMEQCLHALAAFPHLKENVHGEITES